MVSTRRFGRLGNELFQYFAVIGYAMKHGLEYSIPRTTNNEVWNPVHYPHLFNEKWVEGREDILINELWTTEQHYQEIEFKEEWRNKQIVLNGYWQSYKYMHEFRDEILRVFNFPYEKKERTISVHIRRGDYLLHPTKHPVVTYEYLDKAIQYLVSLGLGDYIFLFHSDEIVWAKEYASTLKDIKCEFSEGKNEMEDFISMSECEHQICSNSTMAVVAAEINQNPNKIVVVPGEDNWFGWENRAKMTVKDLYRPEWIKIPYQ